MVQHGAPPPNRLCCRETQSKVLDINAGQSMATLRPIKAACLLPVWPVEGTGGKVMFKCSAAPPPRKCPECAIIMCYCPLLRANGCAPPRSLLKKGEESTQGCTLPRAAGAIDIAPAAQLWKQTRTEKRLVLCSKARLSRCNRAGL